jgi:transposase
MPSEAQVVIGGVDTHKDVHVAAAIDERGKVLDPASFEVTAKGYRELLTWLRSFGELAKVGVEGTGAYGAGLARHLGGAGVEVVEVNRPNRQARRRRGKSDTVDAEAAAPEAVKLFETGSAQTFAISASSGWLIHATVGSLGGMGGRAKRDGLAA